MTGNNIRRSWGEYVLLATAVVSEVVQTWLTEMNFPGGRVAIIPARKEFGSGFWRSHACRRGHGPGRRPCTAGPTGTAGTAASACAGLSSRGATRCTAPRLLPRPSPPPSPPPPSTPPSSSLLGREAVRVLVAAGGHASLGRR